MTLTDFLLARLAEMEKRAREDAADAMVGWRWKHYPREAYEEIQALTLETSKSVLADVEAKRRIVESYLAVVDLFPDPFEAEKVFEVVLPLLALPFADHPDYRDEWRP